MDDVNFHYNILLLVRWKMRGSAEQQ